MQWSHLTLEAQSWEDCCLSSGLKMRERVLIHPAKEGKTWRRQVGPVEVRRSSGSPQGQARSAASHRGRPLPWVLKQAWGGDRRRGPRARADLAGVEQVCEQVKGDGEDSALQRARPCHRTGQEAPTTVAHSGWCWPVCGD